MATRTDGVVGIRTGTPADVPVLVAGRDEVSRRFLGEGAVAPSPAFVVVVAGEVVGWVDHDADRPWLLPGEVNLGYQLFPDHRGRGYATRAVRLLLEHLAATDGVEVATLLIDPANDRSLELAARLGFDRVDDLDGNPYWKLALSPATVPGPAAAAGAPPAARPARRAGSTPPS